MNDTTYTYNDDDSNLASWNSLFTSRHGDGSGDPEEDFLSAIRLVAACKAGGTFLDVGSGIGRIIDLLKPYAGGIVGLEPDRERYIACRDGAAAFDDWIEMFNTTSWEFRRSYRGRGFDFITVSMVIQHISTQACGRLLDDVHGLLKPNGVAMIATTHFYEERFTYQAAPQAHDVSEFDRYAEQVADQDKGIPVRMFSAEAFHRELGRAGLEVILWRQFAYPRADRAAELGGVLAATADQVRDLGSSQYAVVRRMDRSRRRGWLSRLRNR